MNPFAWRQEHQVAILLGAILGAVILEVIGFMHRGLNYATISSGHFWSGSTARWAILGALIGLASFTCDGSCRCEPWRQLSRLVRLAAGNASCLQVSNYISLDLASFVSQLG